MQFSVEWDDEQNIRIKLDKAPKVVNERLHDATIKVVNIIRNTMINAMSRRGEAPWFYYRTKKKKKHHPSLPGHPPVRDSGNYITSIQSDDRWPDVEVGSIITDPPYPEYLEKGTSRMEARPVLEPTIADTRDQIEWELMDAIRGGIQ